MKYAGICIGGPSDGQRVAACAPKMRVAEMIERPFSGPLSASDLAIATDHIYTWKPIAVAEKGEDATEYGFWLAGGITLQQAMNRLITAYERAPRG